MRFSGPALRDARIRSGVSIPALAAGVGRSTEAIRSYEAGRVFPSANVIGALAERLGCSIDDLFAAAEPVDAA